MAIQGPRWSCDSSQSWADAASQRQTALAAGELLVLTLHLAHQWLLATCRTSQQGQKDLPATVPAAGGCGSWF